MSFTVSLVQYLNSAPLGWGFTHGPLAGQVELLLSTPAECAQQLLDGRAGAGLIPVAEYHRIAGVQVVPNIAIATEGRTRSVLLVSRVPAERVRSVALDSSSRTSVMLLKILLPYV